VAEALAERGQPFVVHRMDLGQRLPAGRAQVERLAGLVVLGGPMGVGQGRRYPFLRAEKQLLREAVQAGKPVLGICLGAQLLAAALGGRVGPAPRPEFGLGPVTLLAAGRQDPVLSAGLPAHPGGRYAAGADKVWVFHWHEDALSLPPGAERLARTRHCADQAFRVGERVYGVQFHPELDVDRAADWEVAVHGQVLSPPAIRRALEQSGRRLLGAFFDLA
jgi:GMP synthase (glutamine-hydrolysing)